MRDADLIVLMSNVIDAGMALMFPSLAGYELLQKAQPTQQGTPSGTSVYLQKLFDTPRGWPAVSYSTTEDGQAQLETTTQLISTRFQVSALSWQDPNVALADVITASDIVNQLYQYFITPTSVRFFRAQERNIGLMLSDVIGNLYFENDEHKFEAHPNFEINITHSRTVSVRTPFVDKVEGIVNIIIPPTQALPPGAIDPVTGDIKIVTGETTAV